MNNTTQQKPSKSKIKEKKITHLYFNDKYLKKIPKLSYPFDLVVIYLHSNEIHEINNLEYCQHLTSLYLQKNQIRKIKNLQNLRKLRKLYLGHNCISVVEGLENQEYLEELHLEKQFLHEGNSLCFDPRTVFRLQNTLQVLNISNNKIQTISSLAPLKLLQVFNASNNDLNDIEEVCSVVKSWFYIKDLSLNDNPICKNRLYKEVIIASVYCLDCLDKKDISEYTRNFFKKLHEERVAQRLQSGVNLADKFKDLPKNYPTSVQKAVSISVLKQSRNISDDSLEIFDEKNAVYIPWKILPKPQSVPKLKLMKKQQNRMPKREQPTDNEFNNLKI